MRPPSRRGSQHAATSRFFQGDSSVWGCISRGWPSKTVDPMQIHLTLRWVFQISMLLIETEILFENADKISVVAFVSHATVFTTSSVG